MLRNFSLGSITLPVGLLMLNIDGFMGSSAGSKAYESQEPATAGTVMLSALPIIIGIQLTLNFLAQMCHPSLTGLCTRELTHKRTLVSAERESWREDDDKSCACYAAPEDLSEATKMARTSELWEESCVPSYCHPNPLAASVSWLRLYACRCHGSTLCGCGGTSARLWLVGRGVGPLAAKRNKVRVHRDT